MGIKIYRDTYANSIVFNPSTVGTHFTNSLHAIEGDDGLVYVYDVHSLDKLEIASLPPIEVLDVNGDMVSSDLGDVVNYLNGQFAFSAYIPSGDSPTITSSLSESVIEENPFNYTITATNNPMFYEASGLPTGIVVNHTTGMVFGSTSLVGEHSITISAINAYGTTTETFILTVLADVPGFEDTYSVYFQDSVYKQYLEIGNPTTDIEQSSGEAWSISFWMYADDNDEYDLFSHGKDQKDTKYIKLQSTTLEVGFIDKDNDKSMILRAGSIVKETWYHICVTNSGTGTEEGVTVYVNSVAQENTIIYNALTENVGGTDKLRFGRMSGSPLESSWYDGYLNEISYWDKDLASGEVISIYNGGTPNEVSELEISNLQAWWRMGDDGDVFPNVYDQVGPNDIKMKNMTVTNIVSFTP